MKEITQGVDNINLAANSYKKNRIQVSNTKKPLFFYAILAKVSYAATLHSLLISDESYRPIIGSKRHILYSLLLIITVANVPSRSIKDALKALFGIALYQLNQASLVGLGVVPALVSLIVRDASTGIVEDATAVLAQIAGCKESEEAMRKAGGFRVFCDLLDEWTGASGRIRENAVAALLNLAWCGGENGRKEVREMGAKVMEGITEVAENGSAKGKNKAVELLKFIVDRNGNGNEHPWSSTIRMAIDLEAMGIGGKSSIFQDLFSSGVIKSATDFQVYKEVAGLSGLDFAYTDNGAIYHTKVLDSGERIGLQHFKPVKPLGSGDTGSFKWCHKLNINTITIDRRFELRAS